MTHPATTPGHRRILASVLLGALVGACGTTTITPGTSPGPDASTVPPSASTAGAVPCDTAVASPGTPEAPASWWRDRVFYEVFVRSFADSDGDGIGDLRGLIHRLDYLNDGDPATTTDLGVTALWLMPIAESPSYHGYDVTDYMAVEPDYGTADDVRALMAAAHERGIDVVVDLVLNHSSSEHPWFQDARTPGSDHDDWYVWSDTDAGIAGPGGTEVWHRDGERWYYGYFWEGMPDLNVEEPDVSAALDDVAAFWLGDLGVDGFRLDASKHLVEDGATLENTPATKTWLQDFRSRVQTVDPDALLVGEVWDATSISAEYVRDEALDMTFDFELASAILSAVRLGDAGSLTQVLADVQLRYPRDGFATFLANHDQDRVLDVLGRDRAAAALAATILLTSPGVPFLYYGEEVGMRGRKPDEEIRTPLAWDATEPGHGFTDGTPWEPFAPGVEDADIAGQTDVPASLLSHYRSLIALRAAHPALRDGALVPMDDAPRGVYAVLRQGVDETLLVLANLGDEAVDGASLTLASGPLCGRPTAEVLFGAADVAAPSVTAGGGFDGYVPVTHLEPRQAVVVRLSP